MEISKAQFEQIAECLPRQRGNVSLTNLQVEALVMAPPCFKVPNRSSPPGKRNSSRNAGLPTSLAEHCDACFAVGEAGD